MNFTVNNQPTPAAIAALGDHCEITLHLSHQDAAAIGAMRLSDLTEWFLSALRALAALKTGEVDQETAAGGVTRSPATIETWYWAINNLDTHLMPALDQLRTEVIRAHALAGGSIGNLALAMSAAKSTAQSRREKAVEEGHLWECAETRYDTRGDCDVSLWTVEFLTNLGSVQTRAGETGFMCGSHASQAAQHHEVRLGRMLTSA